MAKFDLVFKGGTVVTPEGTVRADVVVQGEKIVGITIGELTPSATEVIDATGLVILPGGIDTHTHLREPGYTYKEDITTGTRAAAAGGYTTVMGMPNVTPVTTTVERYRDIMEIYRRKAVVDFNHHPSCTNLAEVPGLAKAGIVAFKLFMITDREVNYPHMPELGVSHHGQVLDIAEAVKPTGLPLMIHANDQDLVDTLTQRCLDRGDTSYQAFARRLAEYDGIADDAVVSFLIRLQEVTGVHLHILHCRTVRCVKVLRTAKQAGQKVTVEINPQMLFLCNDWEKIERVGPYALSRWNGPNTTEVLWEALRDGTIDVMATDHAPHTKEDKEIGWTNMFKAGNGTPKMQETLSLILDAVNSKLVTLERAVEFFSTAPAKVFGIYPRKGAIQVGSDADLVVADLNKRFTFRNEDILSKVGWTPWNGVEVQGAPIHTLVRGAFVMRDRKVVGQPGHGQQVVPQKGSEG